MPDWLTNVGVGIAAAGAGAYGMYQKIKLIRFFQRLS